MYFKKHLHILLLLTFPPPPSEFTLKFALSNFGHVRAAHLELMKLVMNKKLKDLKVFPEVRSMYIHSVTFA